MVTPTHQPGTCKDGYVWREAKPGDDVCVTIPVADQTSKDNLEAKSRLAIVAFGPDACIPGFVFRVAFFGDAVCVTQAVRDQTAKENMEAASHTW